MQHEVTRAQALLDGRGRIVEEGWARRPLWAYDRRAIQASALRVKEWDYYSILSHDGRYGVTMTASDLGYAGLYAICFLDFKARHYSQADSLRPFPLGRAGFGPDSDSGDIAYRDAKLSLRLSYARGEGGSVRRSLEFSAPGVADAAGNKGLAGSIELYQPPELESMNIATSWAEKRSAFYYNRKINCMPASGSFELGGRSYGFEAGRDFGALDWGRGRWTYENRWYWGSASGLVGGEAFGFNIGYGFSDRSPASENALIYRGKIHKLSEVLFHIDEADYLKPWRFSSSDGRFEMDFSPLVDRRADTAIGPIVSRQHQVFGEFNGTCRLDDGKEIKLERFLGFAEDVYNRW